MNIILCGLPLTGKTHYGKKLAESLDWPFIDTDLVLEDLYKKKTDQALTCRQIFALNGESYFRELERQAILSLKDIKKSVISIGGGALSSPENITLLKKLGKLIYLESDVEVLLVRLKQKSHPPSYLDPKDPVDSFKQLAKSRTPLYERYCDITIRTDGLSDMEVLARIGSELL
jgi:shikimate kinase